jgi:hypothetical protein
MQESDTYLMILEEGQEKQARKTVLLIGEKKLGPADASVKAQLDRDASVDEKVDGLGHGASIAASLRLRPRRISPHSRRSLTSRPRRWANSSTGKTPRSFSLRERTATVPALCSFSPITSMYGTFSNCASRTFAPILSGR